jgi:hypothetical protein
MGGPAETERTKQLIIAVPESGPGGSSTHGSTKEANFQDTTRQAPFPSESENQSGLTVLALQAAQGCSPLVSALRLLRWRGNC